MALKIYFLDDDDIQIDIMREYVSMCDVQVDAVFSTDSFDTLDQFRNMPAAGLPDVIFVDVFMPLMDGWELLSRLEPVMEQREWHPSIYVVSSSVSNKDREQARRQKHMKAFINKPMKLSKLKPILQDEYDAVSVDR